MKAKLQALLALKIQAFNEPTDPPAKAPVEPPVEQPVKSEPTDPPVKTEPAQKDEKTFTQEDLNRIATKESKQAKEAILKQLGFDSLDAAKQAIESHNNYLESQKTEEQRRQDEMTNLQNENKAYMTTVETLEAKNAALVLGIKADSLEDAITLAKANVNADTDITAALTAVVTKYPHFCTPEQEPTTKPMISAGQHKAPALTEQDQWNQAFKVK